MSVEGQKAADPQAAVAARLLAHAARATRFAGARPDAVQRDLLAPKIYRLTDRQRASVTLMLEALTSEILEAVCTPFEQALGKDVVLGPFGLSEDPELVVVALRAADLHHIETGLRHAAYNDELEGPGLLQRIVDEADPKLIEAVNDYLARTVALPGEEDEPRFSRSDLPPRLDHRLIWEMAEKVAADAFERHGIGRVEADQALARSAMAALNVSDGGALGAAMRLLELYQAKAPIDDAFILDALMEGRLPLLLAALARRTGIDTDELSLMVTEAEVSRLVLALRLAGLSRRTAAHLLSRLFTATGRYAPQDDDRLEECLSGFEAVSSDVAAIALGIESRS